MYKKTRYNIQKVSFVYAHLFHLSSYARRVYYLFSVLGLFISNTSITIGSVVPRCQRFGAAEELVARPST